MLAISLKELFLRHLKNTTLEKSTGFMRIPIEMKTESVKNFSLGIDNLSTKKKLGARSFKHCSWSNTS
jgi:hypothetical protein